MGTTKRERERERERKELRNKIKNFLFKLMKCGYEGLLQYH
jgi:hypothetical protein